MGYFFGILEGEREVELSICEALTIWAPTYI